MKNPWFKKACWIHYPVSFSGYVITILILAFCVQVFMAVDSRSHSVSDTLYGAFPFIVPALLVWDWIAEKTS
ncbi:MAG: hypothetical protein C3F02_02860 [Parcubacteria group bacterium]|nr:MAG: hypothetical protein C3F02_02860 [Parcubacteria group bacterium]